MELRLEINRKNKDRVYALINELLEVEDEERICRVAGNGSTDYRDHPDAHSSQVRDLLSPPSGTLNTSAYTLGKYISPIRARIVGSWGQFNSFFPVKAACRIIANLVSMNREESLRLDRFVAISVTEFKKRGLDRWRGFPSSGKPTAAGRYVWHFLTTAQEMGFIALRVPPGVRDTMPESLSDWDSCYLGISDVGYELAQLRNDLLDQAGNRQVLSASESKLIINHLKEIDSKGYGEFSLLMQVYLYLEEGHNGKDELRHWFEQNASFREYVGSWSRKIGSGSEIEGIRQLSNMGGTFAASKVALLRELGLVDSRRNKYGIVGRLG